MADLQPVRREILAIFDGREEAKADSTRIHRFVEMPLNHLGFVVSYWDIANGPPPSERTSNILGVVTWMDRAQSPEFYVWAQALVAHGARMVVLGEGGFSPVDRPPPEAQLLFNAIGFRVLGPFANLTHLTRVVHRDHVIGFERPLDPALPGYPIVSVIDNDVTSHLTLEHHEAGATFQSSVVLTGSRGGFAASEYIVYVEPVTQQTKWIVDPFAFFKSAFGAPSGPIPDVTTLSGRRIYFSHIDGDGWNNVSRISAFHDAGTISAEVVLRELIAPYPDLPVTVGVIGADIDSRYGHVEAARRAARALFELPQVEVATHSYTHPYRWPFFENYDQRLEAQPTDAGDLRWSAAVRDGLGYLARRFAPNGAVSRGEKEHSHSKGDPPRAYAQFPFDLDQEMRGAVEAAQSLAPAGKPARLYLWSGNADPFEEAIASTRKLGVRNMNGGDSRFDADFPSLTNVAAVARPVGAERQTYAVNSNDFLYITDGQGRDHGFLHLQATLAGTEEPRRLKPVNVYYHMYAGEVAAQLAAVRHNLDQARKSLLTPIPASQYPAIAEGFATTEILAIDGSTWRIRNRGALQTVRFDDATGLALDLTRCTGVIGQNRKGSTLYVSLDEAHGDAVIALAPSDSSKTQPKLPYLIDGRWQLRDLDRQECGFQVTAQGFGAGQMRWGGLALGKYLLSARADGKTVWEGAGEIDESGLLELTVAADAIKPLVIAAACAEPRGLRQ